MSIPDLDATAGLTNTGHRKPLWERGHWVVAAEGRWHLDTPQFRVAWERIPEGQKYHWQYRINQTQEEFSGSIGTFRDGGFELVYSRSFEIPDRTRRFQGVWQKRLTNRSHSSGTIPPGRRPIKTTVKTVPTEVLPTN